MPRPEPILTGPGSPIVTRLDHTGVQGLLPAAGEYWYRFLPREPHELTEDDATPQRIAAGATHWLLYLLLFLMPLSGWLYDAATGLRPLHWFGLFTVPAPIMPNEALADRMHDLHETLFLVLVALVTAHVLAAFWHHLFRNDATLRRMLPKGWLAIALAIGLAPGAARAADYGQAQGSTLAFAGEYDGAPFTGTFPDFRTRLSFDPKHPEQARLEVVVPLATVTTGSRERDETLVGQAFFAVARFPEARYTATGFEPQGDGEYIARGTLELRGVRAPVTLRITWHPGEHPTLVARASMSRTHFGVGSGDWADTTLLPDAIAISARVTFFVQTPAARPYSVSLARAMASSSVSKVRIAATGPKISVSMISDSGAMPVAQWGAPHRNRFELGLPRRTRASGGSSR